MSQPASSPKTRRRWARLPWNIRLVKGVGPSDVLAFLAVILFAGNIYGFAALMQPYLLSEVLHVPRGVQGRLTGLFNGAQYGGILIFISLAGSLADRLGRKAVLIAALTGLSFGLALFPLASSVLAMFVLRFFFGAASTGYSVGSATLMIDYPQNESRGKFVSMMLTAQGVFSIGLLGWVLPHLPIWLQTSGFSAFASACIPFWGLAALGALGVAFGVFFFHPPRQGGKNGGPVLSRAGFRRSLALIGRVWAAGRENPRFGLVILIGFVIRADLYVGVSFLSLWVTGAAREKGLDSATALKTVGVIIAIYQVMVILAPPAFGWIADRVNRMKMLVGTLILSGAAFVSTVLVTDVTGPMMIVIAGVISAAEMGQNVASQVAFGEQAPADLRGSAMGIFFMVGTLSVIIVSFIGGILFDKISPLAPFFLLAALNFLFAFAAIVALWRFSFGGRAQADPSV